MTPNIERKSIFPSNSENAESKSTQKKSAILYGIAERYTGQLDEKSADAIERIIANIIEQTVLGIRNEESNETILGYVKQHSTFLPELDDQLYVDWIDEIRLYWAAPI